MQTFVVKDFRKCALFEYHHHHHRHHRHRRQHAVMSSLSLSLSSKWELLHTSTWIFNSPFLKSIAKSAWIIIGSPKNSKLITEHILFKSPIHTWLFGRIHSSFSHGSFSLKWARVSATINVHYVMSVQENFIYKPGKIELDAAYQLLIRHLVLKKNGFHHHRTHTRTHTQVAKVNVMCSQRNASSA